MFHRMVQGALRTTNQNPAVVTAVVPTRPASDSRLWLPRRDLRVCPVDIHLSDMDHHAVRTIQLSIRDRLRSSIIVMF